MDVTFPDLLLAPVEALSDVVASVGRGISILFGDILPATITGILPNTVRWTYRRLTGYFTVYPLTSKKINNVSQTAHLYLHGTPTPGTDAKAKVVVFFHGDRGHPYSTLHLADMAATTSATHIYSVHMPTEECYSDSLKALMAGALDQIEANVRSEGLELDRLVGVGHSVGCVQVLHRACVVGDNRITSVIAIAGRLKVVEDPIRPCREGLKDTVKQVYDRIVNGSNVNIYEISAGEGDWNAGTEASVVRRKEGCWAVISNAMHLNILFKAETYHVFDRFLNASLVA